LRQFFFLFPAELVLNFSVSVKQKWLFLKQKNSSGFTPRSWKKKNTVVLIVGSTNVDKFDGGSTEKMLKTMTWLLSRQCK